MSDARAAQYTLVDSPSVMEPSVGEHLIVGVRNIGASPWKGALAHATGNVSLAYHWRDLNGGFEVWDDHARTPLLADVPPGGEAALVLSVTPPAKEGRYILQVTLVDNEAWFEQRGARTHDVSVEVRSLTRKEDEARRQRILGMAPLDEAGEAIRQATVAQAAETYGAAHPQQNSYIKLNARRHALMVRLLQERLGPGPLRALSIGFSPVWAELLKKYLPAWEAVHTDIQEMTFFFKSAGERIDYFDAEKDPFPYKEESFDAVIATELVEHLVSDPMHLVTEANRILKPGGSLVITTPNVVRLGAVASLLDGGSQHPFTFSAYVFGGHHREYTPLEVRLLLLAGGFDVAFFDTANVWPVERPPGVLDAALSLLEKNRFPLKWREQDIMAIGRKAGPVRWPRPYPLYLTAELNTVMLESGYE